MESKPWWGWSLIGGCSLYIVLTTYRAFSVPWAWNGDQCLFLFFCFCLGYVAVVYARLIWTGGFDAVRVHWAKVKQMKDPRLEKKAQYRKPIFWVFVAGLMLFSALMVPDVQRWFLGHLR